MVYPKNKEKTQVFMSFLVGSVGSAGKEKERIIPQAH